MSDGVEVQRLIDLTDKVAVQAAIEAIFFAASATKTFADPGVRAAFHERWLGRYLVNDAPFVHVAVEGHGTIVGYLVGCLDDPARTPRFADIAFFAGFSALTARFPAHLHVNLDAAARGRGIGGQLVEAFVADAAHAGLPGVHVVTGRGVRNVSFYERLGFMERGAALSNGREIVFLGRDLSS